MSDYISELRKKEKEEKRQSLEDSLNYRWSLLTKGGSIFLLRHLETLLDFIEELRRE